MLRADNLSKRYGDTLALDRLTLDIGPGEIFCLLGANGAGKTTAIQLFLGFLEPSGGAAYVDDLSVARRPLETKRRLAYVPEQVMLYRHLSGLENLELFASLAEKARPDRDELYRVLARVGLSRADADRRIAAYSKGMRQKVGLAIALARRAKALLLDEPMSGLDPKAANELSALVRDLGSQGACVLMATHDIFRARETGTRVGIMRRGRLVDVLATRDVETAALERLYLDHMRD